MKTLWVVGGGLEAVPGIRRARELGLRVVVSDGDRFAPGFALAHHRYEASTYDPGATSDAALNFLAIPGTRIDGVIALVADVPVTVATVALMLNLHGLSLKVAALGQDKLAMKRRLQALGVLTADGYEVSSHLDMLSRCQPWPEKRFVVKPMDSRGARGVVRLLPGVQWSWAYDQARAQSPTGRVLVEEWLPGQQLSTETVILPDGTYATPGFLDRNYGRLDEFVPYVLEDGADAPTRLLAGERAAVVQLAETAARAVVGHGVGCTVKADMVLTPSGPAVIELALRLSGGYMSSTLVPMNSGVDLVGAAIRLALGEPVTLAEVTPRHDWPVAIRYSIPPGCTDHTGRLGHGIGAGYTREAAIGLADWKVFSREYD